MPVADELIFDYLDNSNVVILNVMYDEYQPYSCLSWANHGNSDIPIMINDGVSLGQGGGNSLESLFFNDITMPKHIFINHELNVFYKEAGSMSNTEVEEIINEMIELKENSQ